MACDVIAGHVSLFFKDSLTEDNKNFTVSQREIYMYMEGLVTTDRSFGYTH